MKFPALILAAVVGMALSLFACHQGSEPMKARAGNPNGNNGSGSEKPDPSSGKKIEKMKALQLQIPTLNEDEFLNVMELGFNGEDRAFFSFSYAPEDDGSLYFSVSQVRLLLKECQNPIERDFTVKILWQEVQGNQRKVIDVFDGSIHEFKFEAEKNYILSYILMDLKEFKDCKAATLKFATFLKDYKNKSH